MAQVSIRDLGLLLLGTGVLILSLLALHFYLTEFLPHVSRAPGLGAYCQSWSEGEAVVTVNNYGKEGIREANVYVGGRLACVLRDIPVGSSDICVSGVEGNTVVFRVVAVTESGRREKEAGICPLYEEKYPVHSD